MADSSDVKGELSMHAALRQFVNGVVATHGVRINYVRVEWYSAGGWRAGNIQIETESVK